MSVQAAINEERVRQQLLAIERQERILVARDELIPYAKLMTPDPNDHENTAVTRYVAAKVHRVIAASLEEVEAGRIKKLILTVPPRHGKTELASKMFPSWFVGRDPSRSIVVCTYNNNYAKDLGRGVRHYMRMPIYKEVFPTCRLMPGSVAADRIQTTHKGLIVFTGREGTITGRGGDLIVIDDPIKNSDEARSQTIRDQVWTWYQRDVISRSMTDQAAVIIIQTRWHEDDLTGRITDPENPCYTHETAEGFHIVDLPALAIDMNDPLGRSPGEALWPERFGRAWLIDAKRRDPAGFSALYQQQPAATDGEFFDKEEIVTYQPHELPQNLRIYAASDHAVATKAENDRTCLLIVGVDDEDNIWVLDCWWKRAKTDVVVAAMIALMRKWQPIRWTAEKDHISKSIEPFLKKRMREEQVYCALNQITAHSDKKQKAQPLKGRMAMGKVLFPAKAKWFSAARDEMLKFDKARHDDFVDALANIARGLHTMQTGSRPKVSKPTAKVGTFAWVKEQSKKKNSTFVRSEY